MPQTCLLQKDALCIRTDYLMDTYKNYTIYCDYADLTYPFQFPKNFPL